VKTQIPGNQILDLTIETQDIADNAVTDQQLSSTGVAAGTYSKVTVGTKGRVTAGTNPTTLAGYGITDAVSTASRNSVITVVNEPDRPAARRLTITPNQIVSTDTGEGGTLNLALASNVIFPGTGAITLTIGTTAQRPLVSTPGMLRFNTTTSAIESPVGADWHRIVMDNDERLRSDFRVVEVRKQPKSYQFGSIAAACDSLIGLPTVNDQWLIDVGPGLYVEPQINIPSYVHVSGFTEYAVYIQPAGTNHPAFSMAPRTSLSFLNVWDATGPEQAGVRIWNTTGGVILHKVCVLRASIGFDIQSTTASTTAYLEYCDTEQNFGTGVFIKSNGFPCSVNLENFYVYGSDSNPASAIIVDGPAAFVNIQSFGLEGVDGLGEGFMLRDGAHLDIKAGAVFGWNIGAHIENTGVASTCNFIATAFSSNTTWDLFSEHPLAIGTLMGTASRVKVNAVASPNFTSAFADPGANAYVRTGDLYMGKTQAQITNIGDLMVETPPMGLLSGGALSPAGGLNISVGGGIGYLRKDGFVTRVEWPTTGITLAPGAAVYVYINKNAVITTGPTEPDGLTNVVLGRANAGATSITGLGTIAIQIASHGNKLEQYLRSAVGPVYVSGSIVSANPVTPRALDITAGKSYYGTTQRNPSAKVATSIVDGHRTAGVTALTTRAIVPNDTIDNGTDLVPVTPGHYMKHGIYSSSEGIFQVTFMSHAQQSFATLDEARLAPLPSPRIPSESTPIIAGVIVKEGVNSIIEILDVRPMFMRASSGTGGGSNDHGDLLGLGDDDHPQYMLASGIRPLAGDLNFFGNDITNISLINGINISNMGARFTPQGIDPIPTSTAVTLTPASLNTEGNWNFLARADHTHQITGFQPASAELTTLAEISTNGIVAHVEPNTWIARTIAGAGGRINVTNGSGISGDPTIDLTIIGTVGTYAQVTTDAFGRVTAGTATLDWLKIANAPTTLAGYGITDAQLKTNILTALSNLSGTGIFAITGTGTAATRTIVAPAAGITVTNGGGVAGDPTIALANDLAAVEGLITTGIAVRAGTDTWLTRSIVGPAAGFTVTNGSAIAGNPTFTLSDDLAAVEGITTLGFVVRSATDTWTTRTLQGSTGNITITTPAGTIGDPVINLAPAGTPGTYQSVTTDGFGRVTSGSNPTTLAGFGISDAQPLDSDLTALATIGTTGLYTLTGPGASATRAVIAGSTKVSVTNGNAVAGNPTVDVVEANLTLNNVGGVLSVAKGGTNLTALGGGNTVLGVNAAATALEYKTELGTANQIVLTAGVGTTTFSLSPNTMIPGTGGVVVPSGTTAQRIATAGAMRLNTTMTQFEAFNGTIWQNLTTPNRLSQYFRGSVAPTAGTTIIPYGNVAPTATQGTQVLSQVVTPSSTTANIEIQFSGIGDLSSTSAYMTVSIFRGTTFIGMSMLASGKQGTDFTSGFGITVIDTPGVLTPVTYTARVGVNIGTWYLGRGQAATFANAALSYWSIKEYS